jgi:hypothetical protein
MLASCVERRPLGFEMRERLSLLWLGVRRALVLRVLELCRLPMQLHDLRFCGRHLTLGVVLHVFYPAVRQVAGIHQRRFGTRERGLQLLAARFGHRFGSQLLLGLLGVCLVCVNRLAGQLGLRHRQLVVERRHGVLQRLHPH